jgi:hypothetical protein
MTEELSFSDVQSALAQAWGGEVRLSGPHPFDRNWFDESAVRLRVEQAPAGAPDKVLLRRVGPDYDSNSREEHTPAHRFFDEWASLAFFQEVCGEATPVPWLYAADREAGFLVMEDLPGPDPVMAAFWGDDPQQLAHMLKRYAILLGEMNGRAVPHTQRFIELRQGFGPIWPIHSPSWVLQQYLQILDALGFGLPSDAQADIAEIAGILSPPTPFLTVLDGDPNPGLVAETVGRLRFFSHSVSGLIHALMDGVFIRMHFPNMGQAHVRRFPESVWRDAENAYRTALAADCPAAADDGSWGRNLTAASAFRALRWTWGNLGLEYMLTSHDVHVNHMRQCNLLRYDLFVQTAAEFHLFPHFARYVADLAARLRERWPEAVEPLALYPAFAGGIDGAKLPE